MVSIYGLFLFIINLLPSLGIDVPKPDKSQLFKILLLPLSEIPALAPSFCVISIPSASKVPCTFNGPCNSKLELITNFSFSGTVISLTIPPSKLNKSKAAVESNNNSPLNSIPPFDSVFLS